MTGDRMILRLVYAHGDQAMVDLGQGTISGDRGQVAMQVAMQVREWIRSSPDLSTDQDEEELGHV